jgi:hypothetical protein
MRYRLQLFVSVVTFLGLLAGAAAIDSEVQYWKSNDSGSQHLVTPSWAAWLALGVLILGIASPILTWPRRTKVV